MTERLTVVEQYLVELGGALRVSGRRRERILAESAAHLRDVTERQMRSGSDPETAQREAIARFGRPEQVAALFNAQRRRSWLQIGRLEPAANADFVLEEEESSPGGAAKLRHRWWIVALVTVVAAAGGVLYARHQPTSYRSTSEVVYNPPQASASQTPNKAGAPHNAAAAFARWVMVKHKWPHTPGDVDRLLSHFTGSPTPAGNGLVRLVFAVTYPDGSTARRIANALAAGFPLYLQQVNPSPKLREIEALIKRIQLEQSDPTRYGPFKKTSRGKIVRNPTTGEPEPDRAEVQLLPVSLQLAKNDLQQYLVAFPAATMVHPASPAARVQRSLAKPLAVGALIGLILGTLLALTLPRPPRRGAPAVDLQP